MKTLFHRFFALLGGASLASLFASLLGGLDQPWYGVLLPILAGNLALAFLIGLILLLLTPIQAAAAHYPESGRWVWLSFFACLVPSLGGLVLAPMFFLPLAVICILLCLAFTKSLPSLRPYLSYAFLFVAIAAAFGGGYWNHQQLRLESAEMASLVLPPPPVGEDFQAADIILISLDTLRSDAIVGPRSPKYTLPFFDGMRARGSWWDYAYSSSNQTLPGHASMLSGKDSLASGVRFNFNSLPGADELPLISEYLQDAGYQTAGVISNGLIAGGMGFSRGYGLYDDSATPHLERLSECLDFLVKHSWIGTLIPEQVAHRALLKSTFRSLRLPARDFGGLGSEERGRVTTAQGVETLEQLYSNSRPFFFFLHYLDAHHPYGAPAPYRGMLTSDLKPLPARYLGLPSARGSIGLEQLDVMRGDLKSSDSVVHAEAVAGAKYYHQMYLENVMYLDSLLEEVRLRVEQSGRPTIWLITADHGEQFAENDSLVHGSHLYQDSVRVPFILTGPGIAPGQHRKGIPDLADVAPTLLDASGLDYPSSMTGRSLLDSGIDSVIPHVICDDVRIMLRYGDHKLIANRSQDGFEVTAVYDLSSDPEESTNLLGQVKIEAQLVAILEEQLLRDRFVDRHQSLSAEQTVALGDLGYVDGGEEE